MNISPMGFVSELRRRNVFRMAVLYLVASWLIMQVAEVLISLQVLPASIGPATFALLVIGFPISLIVSWYFEITPEGLKFEKDVDRAESLTQITGRRMDFIVISLLSAAVILFAYHTWWPRGPVDQSIAVLPFENMSDDPEQEYFSDGLSEELLNLLAQYPELRVISRSSSFSFKGKDLSLREIAELLKVSHVLEGSVRRSGDQIRITAQLIDARTDSHLWSANYDREIGDIFTLQDEIAAAIVGAFGEQLGLGVSPTIRMSSMTTDDAHNAYLRGRYLVVQRARSTIAGAVREFEKAISLDPDYALAHAELALAINLSRSANYGDLTNRQAEERVAPLVERALSLNPTLAEAHAAAGALAVIRDEYAISHFNRAIELNPNYSDAALWLGIELAWVGRYSETIAAYETALRLNPLSRPANSNLIYNLILMNRLADAEIEIERIASIFPDLKATYRGLLRSIGGNWAESALGLLDSLQIMPDLPGERRSLVSLFAAIGLRDEALAMSRTPMPSLMRMLGNPEHAVTIARAQVAEDPTRVTRVNALGLALAAAGEYELAQPILEDVWQWSDRVVTGGFFGPHSAAALIAIRRDADQNADDLVAAIEDNVGRLHDAELSATTYDRSVDYEEGFAAYLAGDRDRGLELISKAVQNGYFVFPNEAYLRVLYDDPGYAPIRAMQNTRQSRERQRFLAIVCTDNPYEAIWRPAAGTCESYAAPN